jgi:hypothetical protein
MFQDHTVADACDLSGDPVLANEWRRTIVSQIALKEYLRNLRAKSDASLEISQMSQCLRVLRRCVHA